MWGRDNRERERVAEELIENFQSSLSSSTITQLLQSQTLSPTIFLFSSSQRFIFTSLSLSVATTTIMRPEGNPLDLNNLPDDYSRGDHGKQILEDTTDPPGCSRKKKNGGKEDGGGECGKVYECRFCSLKFCKSQALGGHMNRHRQERETETLNHARQLVFRNDHNLAPPPPPPSHLLGCCPPMGTPGYITPPINNNMGGGGDPTMPLRFPRYFSASSSSPHIHPSPPPPPQSYLYSSLSSRPVHLMNEYHHHHQNMNFVGGHHESSNYTCIGAPVGHFPGSGGGNKDHHRQEQETLNWGRSYSGEGHHITSPPPAPPNSASMINRFQDGF